MKFSISYKMRAIQSLLSSEIFNFVLNKNVTSNYFELRTCQAFSLEKEQKGFSLLIKMHCNCKHYEYNEKMWQAFLLDNFCFWSEHQLFNVLKTLEML